MTAKCRWNVGEAVEMSPMSKWLLRGTERTWHWGIHVHMENVGKVVEDDIKAFLWG